VDNENKSEASRSIFRRHRNAEIRVILAPIISNMVPFWSPRCSSGDVPMSSVVAH
jgi:hypothetical protein